jgi:hypothetical protein
LTAAIAAGLPTYDRQPIADATLVALEDAQNCGVVIYAACGIEGASVTFLAPADRFFPENFR